MKIDSVNVTTTSLQGANTHHITDVWVEVNTGNLGAYELPCNFPVLLENEVHFTVSAGIEESGQSGVRVIYPFYQTDTFSIIAERAEKYSHVPVFSYKPGTRFAFQPEDFELGNGFSAMPLATDSNVHYGNRCGVISVSVSDSSEEASQINK